jgi:V/A-type H+/Na+-transporting ATPase subunit E
MNETHTESTGVQELIDRLRETGVEEGRTQGEQLLNEARRTAEQQLKQARQQADEIIAEAKREAERLREAGEEAVRLAVRDAVLALKGQLADQFRKRIEQLVSESLENREFVARLILEMAHRALPEEEPGEVEILLPADASDLKQLLDDPERAKEEPLSQLVRSVTDEMLRQGMTLRTGEHHTPGIRVRLLNQDVEIDLTDKAITDLLLKHLLPRFRLLVEGHL